MQHGLSIFNIRHNKQNSCWHPIQSLLLYSFEWVFYEKQKVCPYCGSINTKKNSKKGHKQQYLCKSCLKQFIFKARIHPNELWQEYTQGKQTYEQLAVYRYS